MLKSFLKTSTGLLMIVMTHLSLQGEIITNCQLPGIVCRSEVRTNPPERLYLAEVNLNTPHLHLHVAPGGPKPDASGIWNTTLMEPTRIAAREHFCLVINGDYFIAKGIHDEEGTNSHYHVGQWAYPEGPAMTAGKTWSISSNACPCLILHQDGKATIESITRPAGDDLEVIGGGPILVRQGVVAADLNQVALPHGGKARHPRTVVGLDQTGTQLTILVVDGRKPGVASGMTDAELAVEMVQLGCQSAMNLDGGGSSILAVREAGTGQLKALNQPTDFHERAVANVLGISFDN